MENKIVLNVTINGRDYQRTFEFAVGEFENHNWNVEMDTMFHEHLEEVSICKICGKENFVCSC